MILKIAVITVSAIVAIILPIMFTKSMIFAVCSNNLQFKITTATAFSLLL